MCFPLTGSGNPLVETEQCGAFPVHFPRVRRLTMSAKTPGARFDVHAEHGKASSV